MARVIGWLTMQIRRECRPAMLMKVTGQRLQMRHCSAAQTDFARTAPARLKVNLRRLFSLTILLFIVILFSSRKQ